MTHLRASGKPRLGAESLVTQPMRHARNVPGSDARMLRRQRHVTLNASLGELRKLRNAGSSAGINQRC